MIRLEMPEKKKLSKLLLQINESGIDMKNNIQFVVLGLFCFSLTLMTGCASSELVEIWSDPSIQATSLHKILVISVAQNSVQRRLWEDDFCFELSKHDVVTIPSYHLYPDAVPDTNQVLQSVQSNGFDGILIVRRLPQETKTQYLQGYVTNEQDMRFDRRRDRFVTYYKEVVHTGVIDTEKIDIRAIDIWTPKNEGQLIWSATSKSPEPNSLETVRPEIVKLVMSELIHNGIIGSRK